MSDVVISVEGLGKKYLIKHQAERQRYTALRDVVANKFKELFTKRKAVSGKQKSVEVFWALKDVSFEVKQGEVVGIIGPPRAIDFHQLSAFPISAFPILQ